MIRKVPLKHFVNLLIRIYEDGYDFVDLACTNGEERDIVSIQVLNDYLAKGEGNEYDEDEEEDDMVNDETDINFDDLI